MGTLNPLGPPPFLASVPLLLVSVFIYRYVCILDAQELFSFLLDRELGKKLLEEGTKWGR